MSAPAYPGVVKCEICGFMYCDDIPSDRRQHDALHRRAETAQTALTDIGPAPLPISYAAREELKQNDDLENVMWSHYARSLAAVNYDLKKHPTWQRYAQAYLAQPNTREVFGTAANLLIARFGSKPSRHLPNGVSHWRSGYPVR